MLCKTLSTLVIVVFSILFTKGCWFYCLEYVAMNCRVTQSQYILCVGILLESSLHLSVKTLSGFGLLGLEMKGNVFMSLAVTAISFTHAFSIQRILHCWSLAVTRQVNISFFCPDIWTTEPDISVIQWIWKMNLYLYMRAKGVFTFEI
jgi:hypothetical protein